MQPKEAGPDDFVSHRDDPTAGQMLTVHAAEPGTRTHLMLGAEAAAMAMMDPLLADAQSEVQMTPPAQVYIHLLLEQGRCWNVRSMVGRLVGRSS